MDGASAGTWDQSTIATWFNDHLQTPEAQNLAALAIRGVYGEEEIEISLLDLLQSITGVGGNFNTLIGSDQAVRFVGGPQQMSEHLARALGKRVMLGTPIYLVEQETTRVRLVSRAGESDYAKRVVIAVPKALAGRLLYSPPLPPALDQVLQRQPNGSVVKVNAIYPTPFWREHNLNGQATSEIGPIRITYDNSPPDGTPGVLVGFMEGNDSRLFYGQPAAARRQAALQSFARYFGPQALNPTSYVDLAWAEEPYTRGAYGTFNPPGVLTSLHDPTVDPVGSIFYASGDNSPLNQASMDGAIGDGESTAANVLTTL